jgi:hypothetical protein
MEETEEEQFEDDEQAEPDFADKEPWRTRESSPTAATKKKTANNAGSYRLSPQPSIFSNASQ